MTKAPVLHQTLCSALLLPMAAVALAASPARAQDAGVNFKDKQIRLIVGSAPGGGYDAYGRLLAQYMKPAHPGQSDHRGAEHAGRRLAGRRQLHLQRGAQGRHRHRRGQCHAGDRSAGLSGAGQVRSAPVPLARQRAAREPCRVVWHTDAASRRSTTSSRTSSSSPAPAAPPISIRCSSTRSWAPRSR